MHNMRAMSFRFIGGLTEDYNLGNSLSESSGELFQRVKGEETGWEVFESFPFIATEEIHGFV